MNYLKPSLVVMLCACILLPVACDKSSSGKSGTFQPTATIQGRLTDVTTGNPVVGAVVSIAHGGRVRSFTTKFTGEYSFSNVPATEPGQYYTVVVSNERVTSPASGSSFPRFVYGNVSVNVDDFTPGGDNESHPATKLSAQLDFEYGQLRTGVSGIVRQAENLDYVESSVTVTVSQAVPGSFEKLDLNNLGPGDTCISFEAIKTTCDNEGNFSFQNLPDGCSLLVTFQAAGYKTHEAGIVTLPGNDISLPRDFVFGGPSPSSPASWAGLFNDKDYVELEIDIEDADTDGPVCIDFTSSGGNIPDGTRRLSHTITSFTFTFNERMDTASEAVLRVDGFTGDPDFTKEGHYDIAFGTPVVSTSQWDNTDKVLTVTDLNLMSGYAYTVDLTGLRDLSGNYCTGTFSGNFSGSYPGFAGESEEDGDVLFFFPQAALRFQTAREDEVTTVQNLRQKPSTTDFNSVSVTLQWDQVVDVSNNPLARSYVIQARHNGGPWVDADWLPFKTVPDTTHTVPEVNNLSRDAGGPLYDNIEDYGNSYTGPNWYNGAPKFDFSDGVNTTAANTILEFRVVPVDLSGEPAYDAASAPIAPIDNTSPRVVSMRTGRAQYNFGSANRRQRSFATLVFSEPVVNGTIVTANFYWNNGLVDPMDPNSDTTTESPVIVNVRPRINGVTAGQWDEVFNESIPDLPYYYGELYAINAVELEFTPGPTTDLSRLDTYDCLSGNAGIVDFASNGMAPPVANITRNAYVDYFVDDIVAYLVGTPTYTNNAAGNADTMVVTWSEEVYVPGTAGTSGSFESRVGSGDIIITPVDYSLTTTLTFLEFEDLTVDRDYTLTFNTNVADDDLVSIWPLSGNQRSYTINVAADDTVTITHVDSTIPQD